MKTAFLFPGQGAQAVGMGKDVYEATRAGKEYFDRAEAATRLPLKALCFDGPQQELSATDIAQPAIFTVSAAILACLCEHLGRRQMDEAAPFVMAGLSLGEYTALYAAGAMDFETGVRLVARRGQLMQQAAAARPSGMVCILGLDEDKARDLAAAAAEGQVLRCANFNCPTQVVLSGEAEACRRAAELAGQFGASGAVPLQVAGAFHSELMRPAAEKFAEALNAADIKSPITPVLSNVDGEAHDGPDQIRARLLAQLTSPVRWQLCVDNMISRGAERFWEIGPGRVLAGLLRRIDKSRQCTCINGLKAIERLPVSLAGPK